MNKNSLALEQKRAELQVKLTILQENINNLKNELSLDEEKNINNLYPEQNPNLSNLLILSNEYNSANELYKLKQLERNTLEDEVIKERQNLEKLKLICNDLIQQRTSLEQENLYYKNKSAELEDTMEKQRQILSEMQNKKEILKQEVEILKNENISSTKFQYDNEQIEKNSNEQKEYIDDQLTRNAKRIQLLN